MEEASCNEQPESDPAKQWPIDKHGIVRLLRTTKSDPNDLVKGVDALTAGYFELPCELFRSPLPGAGDRLPKA